MTPSRHAWILLIALAGCAPAQWEKPGANAATVKDDSDACRSQARHASPPPFATNAPSAMVETKTLSRDEQLAAYESEQFQRCMHNKGYAASR